MTTLDTIQALCNIPDIVILLVLLAAFFVGWHKGLLHTLYKLGGKLAALVASLLIAKCFAPLVASTVIAPLVEDYISKTYAEMLASSPLPTDAIQSTVMAGITSAAESIAYCALFFLCFVTITWAMNVLINGAKAIMKKTPLNAINRLGGALVSMIGAAVLLLLALVLLRVLSPDTFRTYGVLSPEKVQQTYLLQLVLNAFPPLT